MSKLELLALSFGPIVMAIGVFLLREFVVTPALPSQLLNHHAVVDPELLSVEERNALLNTMKEIKVFPTNVADTDFYEAMRDNVGEARPTEPDGSCSHPFLVPNSSGECVLPGRIDIGKHFLTTGGYGALKEPYEVAVSRVQSFGVYLFDYEKYPVMKDLLESDKFQALTKAVCPKDKRFLDPFQANIIVALPGQATAATHIDGVYFQGASRFSFPQWLLAVMKFSGLFENLFVPQVQSVAYFHEWEWTEEHGGEFVYWKTNELPSGVVHVPPRSLSGTGVDGSTVVHSGTVYRPNVQPPFLDKSLHHALEYAGNDEWNLVTNRTVVREKYATSDLRLVVVYRARCFSNEDEVKAYRKQLETGKGTLSLMDVLRPLQEELLKRGYSRESVDLAERNRLKFALTCISEFIKYPMPTRGVIPFNYCVLIKLVPFTRHLLRFVC